MNQHDLHAALGDLARQGADEQTERLHRGAGLSASDIARRSSRVRRRRTAVTAATGLAAVAGLVLAGSALADRPDPQPADTPTITHPTPEPSRAPVPSPAASAQAAGSDEHDPALATSGVVRPYPTTPSVRWRAPLDTLWTSTVADSQDATPVLGDVASIPHSYPGARALAAGGTFLFAVGVPPFDERLVGVDEAGGAVRWGWDQTGDEQVLSCAGVYEGLLVCQGEADGAPVVQLRDPVSGAVARTVGPGGNGIAVADDAVVVHRTEGADVHVRVLELADGALRVAVDLPGYVDPSTPGGDFVVRPETVGPFVLLYGVRFQLALDVRTGSVLAAGMRPVGLRADGWVTAVAPDGSTHAVGPHGEDVLLPGSAPHTPRFWAPAADVDVPLLTSSDRSDGLPDSVSAVDPASGEVLWSFDGVGGVQAVAGRTAVLLGDTGLVGVDVVTGAELWRTGPADVEALDGERYVVSDVSGVRAVRATDGEVAWTLPRDQVSQVIVVGSSLVGVAPDGSLSALVP